MRRMKDVLDELDRKHFEPPTRKVYLCGITWQHELDDDVCGHHKVYSNLDSLKEDHPMWEECGIIEADLTNMKWIADQHIGRKNESP